MPLNSGTQPADNPQGWLLVANKGDNALGIVNPAEGKQVAEVPEGGVTGHEVIASPDGKTARSEERRGGKECRSRWSPDH